MPAEARGKTTDDSCTTQPILGPDFMHDTLYYGKHFRALNVLDEGTRECLGIEIDTGLSAEREIRIPERIKEERGLPRQLRVDNGPEFVSGKVAQWCENKGITLHYIGRGKPTQNGFIGRFNGSFRSEFLNVCLFESLSQVREMTWLWQEDYNRTRTHESIRNIPPCFLPEKLENANLNF